MNRGVHRRRAVPSATRTLCAAVLLLTTFAATAGGWRALDLPERLEGAREALVGRVASVDVEVRDGEPWTIVTVEVERWWRREGRATDEGPNEVRVALWGGRAPGAATLLVSGAPAFAAGERVVLWLRSLDAGLAIPIVGVDQGAWWASEGAWRGADGQDLSVGVDGRLVLDGAQVPDALLFDAIDQAFFELEEASP